MNVLLVEDDESLHEGIKLNLELESYKVYSAFDGKTALEQFDKYKVQLIILDVMIPVINGFDVCETIRLKDQKTPILFLTARDEMEDKLNGLSIGGDDYLTKPFNLKELLLRVKNLAKRSNQEESAALSIFEIDGKTIDFESFEIRYSDGKVEKLSEKQAKLLKLLIDHKGKAVSRKEILQKVWDYETVPNTRTIDNVILSLRKLLEDGEKTYFQSVRGVGYKFSH